MGPARRAALAAAILYSLTALPIWAAEKPLEPRTTSTTDRLKAKKKPSSVTLDRKTAEAPASKPETRKKVAPRTVQ
jgi:hypothetical protein